MKKLIAALVIVSSGCSVRGPYVRAEDRRAVEKALEECRAELEAKFKDRGQPLMIFNGPRFDACMSRRGWEPEPQARVPY